MTQVREMMRNVVSIAECFYVKDEMRKYTQDAMSANEIVDGIDHAWPFILAGI